MTVVKDVFIGEFRISQKFAENPQMYKQFGLAGHNGIDWATPNGTSLVCCFSEAEVIQTDDDGNGYGKHIKLWDRQQKVVAIYGHCQEFIVKVGQIVKFGQLIAISDNTGFSTGDHLHFGLLKVDDECKRLNTDNGYAGWLNPFDGRIFKWEVENIKNPFVYEDMTQDETRALDALKRYKTEFKDSSLEGTADAGAGARRDLQNVKNDNDSLRGVIATQSEILERLEAEIAENDDLIVTCQKETVAANSKLTKTTQNLDDMTKDRDDWRNRYNNKLAEFNQDIGIRVQAKLDAMTTSDIFTLLVKKLFNK